MRKIAFINQRYGLEVNGGSEFYTREMAEHMKDDFDVEILTTKSVDYVTWENYYEKDEEYINGVLVRRFTVDETRDMKSFSNLTNKVVNNSKRTVEDERFWLSKQGPVSSKLIEYIKSNKDRYDVFVFVTYLYYITAIALPEVINKSILIPTAHDEPFIYFSIYKEIFKKVKAIIYLTEEERFLTNRIFKNEDVKNEIMAIGIDYPKKLRPISYKIENHLDEYIIYVGRIDRGKMCDVLFEYFIRFKYENPKNRLKLVLIGKDIIEIPKHPDIKYMGFVSEEDKFSAILSSKVLVLPSKYESLSIAVLEAMAMSKPVIVNEECEVLKGHCVKSNAGLYYSNYKEFSACINYLMSHQQEYLMMCRNAKKYIEQNYSWDIVKRKFRSIVEYVVTELEN